MAGGWDLSIGGAPEDQPASHPGYSHPLAKWPSLIAPGPGVHKAAPSHH